MGLVVCWSAHPGSALNNQLRCTGFVCVTIFLLIAIYCSAWFYTVVKTSTKGDTVKAASPCQQTYKANGLTSISLNQAVDLGSSISKPANL